MAEDLYKSGKIKKITADLKSTSSNCYKLNISPLDILLGGGIYSGKTVEISGLPSAGKSTLALSIVKTFQDYCIMNDLPFEILWIETEGAFDMLRTKWFGIDVDKNFYITEVEAVEDGFDALNAILTRAEQDKFLPMIVWDTIANTSTRANLQSDNEWSGGIGEKNRIISSQVKKLSMRIASTNASLLMINQVYTDIKAPTYMASSKKLYKTPGGLALQHLCSVRLRLTKTGVEKITLSNGMVDESTIITEVFSEKNKLTLPNQKCNLYLHGENGLLGLETIINHLIDNKIIDKAGGWKELTLWDSSLDNIKFNNMKSINDHINKNPKIMEWLDYLVYSSYAQHSPLMKIKLLKQLWLYEEMFFNERKTELSPKELETATVIYNELRKDEDTQLENKDDIEEAIKEFSETKKRKKTK